MNSGSLTKFLAVGIPSIAVVGTILGGDAISHFIESNMQTPKEQYADLVEITTHQQAKSEETFRNKEIALLHEKHINPNHFQKTDKLFLNYYQECVDHRNKDPYANMLETYDRALNNPLLPTYPGLPAEDVYKQRKEQQKVQAHQKYLKEREELYQKLVKEGKIDVK